MNQIKPDQIESISVLKDKSGITLYGDMGKNGVILITTKAKAGSQEGKGLPYSAEKVETQDGKTVFVVVEEMPEFPGGEKSLERFYRQQCEISEDAKKEGIQGRALSLSW